jgi:hypothetical protein
LSKGVAATLLEILVATFPRCMNAQRKNRLVLSQDENILRASLKKFRPKV